MKLNPYRLACAMANAEMTAGELCDITQVSNKMIAAYIAGKGNPKPSTVGKLAKALNCKVEYIAEED